MIKPVIDLKALREIDVTDLCTGSSFEGVCIVSGDVSEEPLDDLSFDRAFLDGVTLNQCVMDDLSALDTLFSSCNLAGVSVERPYFARFEARGCRMQGIQLSQARAFDCAFISSKLNSINFRYARLKNVLFDSCDLSDADFVSAEMKNIVFKNCNLTCANFSQTTLTDVDLAGSQIDDIIIDPAAIKQVYVDTAQALYISSIFGLRIRD